MRIAGAAWAQQAEKRAGRMVAHKKELRSNDSSLGDSSLSFETDTFSNALRILIISSVVFTNASRTGLLF